jgi:hypothetical protein
MLKYLFGTFAKQGNSRKNCSSANKRTEDNAK